MKKPSFQLLSFLHTDAEEFLQRQHFHFSLSHTFPHAQTQKPPTHPPLGFPSASKCGLMRHHPGALSATPTLPVSSEGGEEREWAGACETLSTGNIKGGSVDECSYLGGMTVVCA